MVSTFRGADLVTRFLKNAGIDRWFALSGNQIMPLFDASIDAGVDLFHVRQEAAAVHMADAWGRLTGKIGVAVVTAGPGLANCLSALYVAKMSESPMLLLSGRAPSNRNGLGSFQEMPQAKIAKPVCKASWSVSDANRLSEDLSLALQLAGGGRPGPVHLSLPFDIVQAPVDLPPNQDASRSSFQLRGNPIDPSLTKQIVAALHGAKRPIILSGPSSMRGNSGDRLSEFQQLTNVPAIGMESPRGVNDPSLGAIAQILPQADMVLLFGKEMNFTLRQQGELIFNPDCQFMQLDAEKSTIELTRRVLDDSSRLTLAGVAESSMAIEALLKSASDLTWPASEWIQQVLAATSYRPANWSEIDDSPPLHPSRVCDSINSFLAAPNSVLVSDGGEFGQWAQACIRADQRIINGPSGSIGSAIPFALAARLACPDSKVVATLGDGTFGFHAMEFDTAVRYDLPFTAVVGNDAMWNAEHQIQLRDYGPDRTVACDLLPTRYDQVAASLGGFGEHVESVTALPAALQRADRSRLPACLNVPIARVAAPTF